MMPTIYPVTAHTKHVGQGSTFVAIQGLKEDGVDFIPEALDRGATTIVVAHDALIKYATDQAIAYHKAELVRVENTRQALAELSAAAAGYPARTLKIIGFTGTKGKTTSVYLLEHIMRLNGFRTARITGVSNMICGYELPASLTTPQPDYLHQFFKLCVEQEVTHVVMEVAAQGLSFNRVDTITFDIAVFTNLSREHFEIYENMEEYFRVKTAIFNHTTHDALRLCNMHDAWTTTLIGQDHTIHGYGFIGNTTPYSACNPVAYPAVSFKRKGTRISAPSLIGMYNAHNLLAVVLCAERYGISGEQINVALASFEIVPGRMEKHTLANNVTAIIDYAHNPSSYSALLSTLRPLTEQLIVIFGASGTRDKGKRPLMGAAAAEYADVLVLTSDNPGPEAPQYIIQCIKEGITTERQQRIHIIEEPDRRHAIEKAYAIAKPGAIIALLGKGPDEYQMIQGTRTVFSERAILKELQRQKNK